MPHEQLIEFARMRLSQGASPTEIEAHLRGQAYDNEVGARVLRAIGDADAP